MQSSIFWKLKNQPNQDNFGLLKAGVALDFFTTRENRRGLISITGSVTDKNCSEQSLFEMSVT